MGEARRNPETPEEWQDAADAAQLALVVESARLYGLITGGSEVNVERCEDVLLMARDRGIEPRPTDDLIADPHLRELVGLAAPPDATGSAG